VLGLFTHTESLLGPYKAKEDLLPFIKERYKLWTRFSRFDGEKYELDETLVVELVLMQAKTIPEYKEFITDFMMEEMLPLEFSAVKFNKLSEKLIQFLMSMDTGIIEGLAEQSILNAGLDLAHVKRSGKDSNFPKGRAGKKNKETGEDEKSQESEEDKSSSDFN